MRPCRLLLSAVAAVLLSSGICRAQEWPGKQRIRVIVPLTAGSTADVVGRAVFQQVSKQINQAIIVENRGGAGTTIGTTAVATSDPDGYTLLVTTASLAVIATTYKGKLSYDVADSLAGVSILADMPFIVGTSTKFKTLSELVSYAKSKSGILNYGTAGVGTSGHLFMEWLAINAGFKATAVAFRGTPEAVNEIVAGRLDVYPLAVMGGLELASAGKLNTLAVSSLKRVPHLPNVPTLSEVGLAKATYNFWVGAFIPRKTSAAIQKRLNKEVVAALNVKDVADRISALGGSPQPMTPEETDAFLKKEIDVNANIISTAGLKLGAR
jgi:tripartite-type tricarboxylate transporter receptor subunit TctC